MTPNRYYSPSTGPWLPPSRRRRRPRRWLRYPLGAVVLVFVLLFGLPRWPTGASTEPVQVTNPCGPRAALSWIRPFHAAEGYPDAR